MRTTTSFDARNNRVSLQVPGQGETTYDPNHGYLVDTVYVPTKVNGLNEVVAEHRADHDYDARDRLVSINQSVCPVTAKTHSCTSAAITTGDNDYLLDANSNRTQVKESRDGGAQVTKNFCYDGLDRLRAMAAGSCSTLTGDETFDYDAAGNRTLAAGTSFAYDTEGQLCKVGATTCGTPNVTYDSAGRTMTWNGWTLTYDGEGRLASACKIAGCATGDKVEMRYDGDGRRVELITRPNGGSTTTTTFRYQGAALAQELTGGTLTRTYISDESGAVVKVCDPDCTGSNPQYLVTWNGHGDALGVWLIDPTDGTLTLENSYSYSTWGQPSTFTHNGAGDLAFRFLYVGRFGVAWDSAFGLGLHYMSARHYSPALGRFLQPDPAAAEANFYQYAGNAPTSAADPEGTRFDLFSGGGGFGLGLGRGTIPRTIVGAEGRGWNLSSWFRGTRASQRGQFRIPGPRSYIGRSQKQERLRQLMDDDKAPSYVRGWLRQEQNAIARGRRSSMRVPPGHQLAHGRTTPARGGFSYIYSKLQSIDLHRLQHRIGGY